MAALVANIQRHRSNPIKEGDETKPQGRQVASAVFGCKDLTSLILSFTCPAREYYKYASIDRSFNQIYGARTTSLRTIAHYDSSKIDQLVKIKDPVFLSSQARSLAKESRIAHLLNERRKLENESSIRVDYHAIAAFVPWWILEVKFICSLTPEQLENISRILDRFDYF